MPIVLSRKRGLPARVMKHRQGTKKRQGHQD